MARRLRASNPAKATRHKPEPVEVRNVAHPRIWQTALKLANGRHELIVVESFNRVSVTV